MMTDRSYTHLELHKQDVYKYTRKHTQTHSHTTPAYRKKNWSVDV